MISMIYGATVAFAVVISLVSFVIKKVPGVVVAAAASSVLFPVVNVMTSCVVIYCLFRKSNEHS